MLEFNACVFRDFCLFPSTPYEFFRTLLRIRPQAPVGYWDPMGMAKDGDEKTLLGP